MAENVPWELAIACVRCSSRRSQMDVVQATCESCTFECPTCPCRWDAVAPELFDLVENEFGHSSINFPDGRNAKIAGTLRLLK